MLKETYEKAIGSKRIISNLIAILFTFLTLRVRLSDQQAEAAKKNSIF